MAGYTEPMGRSRGTSLDRARVKVFASVASVLGMGVLGTLPAANAWAAPKAEPKTVERAQRDDRADRADRAMDLFTTARARYRDGRFKEAVELLRQAYAVHPEPVLLFNLGRALEDLGDLSNAADAYERYLASEPKAPDRGAIEERARSLRVRVAEQERLRRERTDADARATEARAAATGPQRSSAVPWILGGAGIAAAGTGAVFGLMARAKESDAADDPEQRTASYALDSAKRSATTANVLFAAGGALAGAGIVSFVLLRPRATTITAGPSALFVAGTF